MSTNVDHNFIDKIAKQSLQDTYIFCTDSIMNQ